VGSRTGLADPEIQQKVIDFKADMQAVVEAKAAKMEQESRP